MGTKIDQPPAALLVLFLQIYSCYQGRMQKGLNPSKKDVLLYR